MEMPRTDLEMLRSFRASCASVLKNFAASSSSFKLVRTVRHDRSPAAETVAKTLYVLDGSFNPPTTAHHRIAKSALSSDRGPGPKRVLLLLATQNADKAKKGASFEDRLVMMNLSAHELIYDAQNQRDLLSVDIGLIKQPYFHDKAAAIDECHAYPASPQQVHLVGFDTLIRILDTKYYPPDYNLQVLEPFLSKHRLRATYRADNGWGSRRDQNEYVQDIANGKRLHEGAKPEWACQLSLFDGQGNNEDIVSSTLARKAARSNSNQLDEYVMPTVRDWIVSERLYLEDD